MSRDGDTLPTLDDGLLDELRRDGLLGPFDVVGVAGRSITGLVRDANEDVWGQGPGPIFAVADGIGGRPGGAIAASAAVRSLTVRTDASLIEPGRLLSDADEAVRAAGEANGVGDAGTTVVALIAFPGHCLVMSVGDSRVYRRRDGEVKLLTTDHNVRSELVAAGVPLDHAKDHGVRLDLLTAHVGAPPSARLKASIHTFSLQHGDRYLLCSDGVHGQISYDVLESGLAQEDCADSVSLLLERSIEAGGLDNATAVVVDFASIGATP